MRLECLDNVIVSFRLKKYHNARNARALTHGDISCDACIDDFFLGPWIKSEQKYPFSFPNTF